MSHTAGPWETENNEDDDFESWRIVSAATDNRDTVAIVQKTGDEQYDHRVTWPNARLIAAAPELLEAARMLLDNADDLDETHRDDGSPYDDWEALRAAIAKATGEVA